ncbi:hypothetical protein BH20ACT2_BH20ACT2_12100 [soil metagenome]
MSAAYGSHRVAVSPSPGTLEAMSDDELPRRHPVWMQAVAWICLLGVIALVLANAFRF